MSNRARILGGAAAAVIALAGATYVAVEPDAAERFAGDISTSTASLFGFPADETLTSEAIETRDLNREQLALARGQRATAGIALSRVDNPASTLAAAQVEDRSGQSIGRVDEIVLGANGKAKAVNVAYGGFLGIGTTQVSIPAGKLSYLRTQKRLVAKMTEAEVKALPEI